MIIERFGLTSIPAYDPVTDAGTFPSISGLIGNPDGAADIYGSNQAPRDKYVLRKSCALVEASSADLQTALDALRARRGERDQLFFRMRDGTVRWLYARLMQIVISQAHNDILRQKLDLSFEIHPQNWNGEQHGADWTLDSGEYFDTGLYFDQGTGDVVTLSAGSGNNNNFAITNNGNSPVKNAVLTIAAGSVDITNVVITSGKGSHLIYAGTITAGQDLIIDCGAWSVNNNGAGDYDNFSLGGSHEIDYWVILDPGSNPFTVVLTGGGTDSTITFEFADGWQ